MHRAYTKSLHKERKLYVKKGSRKKWGISGVKSTAQASSMDGSGCRVQGLWRARDDMV